MRLPGGWIVRFRNPVLVWKPNPRNWRCQSCAKLMRVEQMTYEGYCPHCGGRMRRESPPT